MQGKRLVYVLLTTAFIFCAGRAYAQDRNLLPKYGSSPLTKAEKDANAAFISAIDEQYHGDRNKASTDLAGRGWQYLGGGDPSDAMRRFNQAWLLNKSNGVALWGMAAVQADSEQFDDALKLFTEAEKFVGSEINFSVDYARALGVAGARLGDDTLLKYAFNRFDRNYQKAPQNARNLKNWAITLFSIGKYSEAWDKVELAEGTPNKGDLDPRFVADLQSKMPRPQH